MRDKIKVKPKVAVTLSGPGGISKTVNSCDGAIMWWSKYQAHFWFRRQEEKHGDDPVWDNRKWLNLRQREEKYHRRVRPIFERIFGVK